MATPLLKVDKNKLRSVACTFRKHSIKVYFHALVVGLGLVAEGCANEVESNPVEVDVVNPTANLEIYGGTEDNDGEALPGVVALRIGAGGTFELCSGALVAPNLVLTARHCVTKNVTTSVSCDENGRSANGKHISGEQDPTIIGVYTGPEPNFAHKPQATGRAIVTPKGPYLCDSDIALVALDQAIDDITPLAMRLDAPARVNETIRAVGYGQNDQGVPIGTRFRKSGISVLAQGRGVSASGTPLGAHEFEVGRSICQGDSGGPAISEESLAVIGVVSRGSGCDDDYGHIYTTTAGFNELLDEAFTIAGATPIAEPVALGDNTTPTQATSPGTVNNSSSSPNAGCALGAQGGSQSWTANITFGLAILLLLRFRRR
ncbi:MAG: S1 family peptidase [Polyangiaceae bacterium]|nr:S1 family peptidase [Polyangiaceae bacterium]